MPKLLRILLILGATTLWAKAETVTVRHDHDPWGSCQGQLSVSESGIEFASEKAEHSRRWGWTDIQSFERISESRFSIVTWKDRKWLAGRDLRFDFETPPGGTPLSPGSFAQISERMKGTWIDGLVHKFQPEYSVAAKHLHLLGGCQGVLRFGKDWIVFESEREGHSRSWRRARDVDSAWSANPYLLEIHVYEDSVRSFDKTASYRFQLKEPLDRSYYERLRRGQLAAGWIP